MLVTFHIHYHTTWGQRIFIKGDLGKAQVDHTNFETVPLEYMGGGSWQLTREIHNQQDISLSYNYYLLDEQAGRMDKEWGPERQLTLSFAKYESTIIRDYWRSRSHPNYSLLSSAFTRSLFKRTPGKKNRRKSANQVLSFRLLASRLPEDAHFCVVGNIPALGEWDTSKALVLSDKDFPSWQAEIGLTQGTQEIEYKYGIINTHTQEVLSLEAGENRHIRIVTKEAKEVFIQQDEVYRYPKENWRGSGIALPVFSLRSKKSWGVGDFEDLKGLIDWASSTHQKLVQILPINDTTATHTWVDSYPYAAISVFALHPQYVCPEKMGKLRDRKFLAVFRKEAEKLNALSEIDFEGVMALKLRFIKLLYEQEKERLEKDNSYQKFIKENKDWLHPYAVFCYLRDQHKSVHFEDWGAFATFDQKKVNAFGRKSHKAYHEVAIHYFIQYHLHLQLTEASAYARAKSIVLKGDIPIGIYRYSVDAWISPQLYNMQAQAGAPPDDFAVEGQNWGFPTYDWEEMAKNDFLWWRQRLSHMARYFDAYRIDHILGFFRIWQIPYPQVQGLLGVFNPALPYSAEELQYSGLDFDESRFCKPYVREHVLKDYFGEHTDRIKQEFLEKDHTTFDAYSFKEALNSQRKITDYIKQAKEAEKSEYYDAVAEGLKNLVGEFLFHVEKREGNSYYHPRIALHYTRSFGDLQEHQKRVLESIYNSYFYHRHDEFWKNQALVKLPAIVDSTEMLVCGEDLGMVPDSVPSVMAELGLLSLEIQRMPKETDREFVDLNHVPYLSVVSPSSHDMTPLRAWWEEDRESTQRYYNHVLGWHGNAPFFCEADISKEILLRHLQSPSMWAIFPLQDLLSIDNDLRREKPLEERINVPANPQHYWRYRFHISIEDLLKESKFNSEVRGMIQKSGRNQDY